MAGPELSRRCEFLVTTIQDLPQTGESINEDIARLWQFCSFKKEHEFGTHGTNLATAKDN